MLVTDVLEGFSLHPEDWIKNQVSMIYNFYLSLTLKTNELVFAVGGNQPI
jgi:hypothetical protein